MPDPLPDSQLAEIKARAERIEMPGHRGVWSSQWIEDACVDRRALLDEVTRLRAVEQRCAELPEKWNDLAARIRVRSNLGAGAAYIAANHLENCADTLEAALKGAVQDE